MGRVFVVDYELGNLFSVRQALASIGLTVVVSNSARELERADAVVLPGVGAFKDAMSNLHRFDLVNPLLDFVASGKPFMGICLGLQLLFSESEEFGSSKGLNIIEGAVRRFSTLNGDTMKVPQIAWNTIEPMQDWNRTPLESIPTGAWMYFVHSYYVLPDDTSVVLSTTTYHHTEYASSIVKENVFACQFHPEKSATTGLLVYKNWSNINGLQ